MTACSRIWEFVDPASNAVILKTKTFFGFYSLNAIKHIKFWTFWEKRWSSHLFYFRNYRLSMTWLEQSLKNTVSEHPLTVNMLKGPKLFWNVHERTLIIFFITLREPALEYTSISDILNLGVAWYLIDCQWQVRCSRNREFVDLASNAIILNTKTFFGFSCSIAINYIKFWTFSKKRWSSHLLFFRNYRLPMTWFDLSLKNTVSEQPLTVNMLNVPKHF